MWLPMPEHLIDMHDRIIERTGGEAGILNRGALEAAVARARWGPFRHGGDLQERAALLTRGITQDHPFVDLHEPVGSCALGGQVLLDGNKRTAYEAADLFLDHNGVYIDAAPEVITTFMVRVARSTLTVREITRWLQDHLQGY